jgi:hypothetical protein
MLILHPLKIQKTYSIKKLNELEKIIQEEQTQYQEELQEYYNKKDDWILKIKKRIEFLQNYYKDKNYDKFKNLSIYTIYYSKEEDNLLKQDLKKLQDYTKNINLKIKDLIKIKSLSQDTLRPQELHQKQAIQDTQKEKEYNVKETLKIFRGLANNINQIAKNINEKKLMNNFFSNEITKEERQKILSSIEAIEKEFINFIKKI